MSIRNLMICATITAIALTAGNAAAGWSPSHPIDFQIGFAPGGSADAMGRLLAEAIEKNNGWKLVVENKGGGGGSVMAAGLMRKEADGYSLGLAVSSAMASALAAGKTPFSLDSFDYLGTIAVAPAAFLAKADAPFDDMVGLVAYARAQGDALVASPGKDSEAIIRAIARTQNVKLLSLPTKGGAAAITAVLGGTAAAGFSGGQHQEYLKSGQLKVIATATRKRQSLAPDAKTLLEQGFPYSVEPYFVVLAPKGLPTEVRTAVVAAVDNAVKSEGLVSAVDNVFGIAPVNLGPDGTYEALQNSVKQAKELEQ